MVSLNAERIAAHLVAGSFLRFLDVGVILTLGTQEVFPFGSGLS